MKSKISIVWFKRDLRLEDHAPLSEACGCPYPLLLIYIYEPSVMAYPDFSIRHGRFVRQSLDDINCQLVQYQSTINIFVDEVEFVFDLIQDKYEIDSVFSHSETGNNLTFQRDLKMKKYFKKHQITWIEYQTNGVIRALKSRVDWSERWKQFMDFPLIKSDLKNKQWIDLKNEDWRQKLSPEIFEQNLDFQIGGETTGRKYLQSFFLSKRIESYSKHISKPTEARKSCSRISPYIAWGNLSMRYVVQYSLYNKENVANKRNLYNYMSRLHWQSHFIQKFESECSMEFYNLNSAFNQIRNTEDIEKVQAWQNGQTGFPLVDACIKCVEKTGYLNFRMRAMVVSFLTHNLYQPWQSGVYWLARQFLDYEPGIHFPQFQMQAGTMGVNTIRIYNPIKQSQDHDPEGAFIKKWLPVLSHIPSILVHEPWKLTFIEQQMYQCELGKDYPNPIINISEAGKKAREEVWAIKKSTEAKIENISILQKHTHRRKISEKRK